MTMDDIDKAILEIESQHWRHIGTKEAAIRDRLGMSPTRYYQRLSRLVQQPEAANHAPVTTSRLRALQDRRRR